MDKDFVLKVREIEHKLMLRELKSLRMINFLKDHPTMSDKVKRYEEELIEWRQRCGVNAHTFEHTSTVLEEDAFGNPIITPSLYLLPKVVRSSNLALRFYLSDQWTKAELDACCAPGEVLISHPKDGKNAYFTLAHPSYMFDVDKLIKLVAKVERAFNDYPNESDYEFLKRMNGG